MSSQYLSLVSPNESGSQDTPPVKRGSSFWCNGNRFIITTLSVVIIILLSAILFLVKFPPRSPSTVSCAGTCAEGAEQRKGRQIMTRDIFQVGIITDIHFMVNPDDCVANKGWKYGTFGCDSTEALLDTTLHAMSDQLILNSSTPSQNVIFMLGDAAQHQAEASWSTNITITAIHSVYSRFSAKFPDTPVFPTIGNNDLERHNAVPDPSWYDTLLPVFESALRRGDRVELSPDFQDVFRNGGYYSARLSGTGPSGGLTVISLNTNLLASKVVGSQQYTATADQLRWLERELEKAVGRVAIIGHHPPILSFFALRYSVLQNHWDEGYAEEFFKIYRNYKDKIMGMFAGHEHQDSFGAMRYENADISVFSLPSVSPVYQGQPSFSIATVTNNYHVLDIQAHHTWLDFYNRLRKEPKYLESTSYSDILGLTQLNSSALLDGARIIIRESDKMATFISLRNKVYQDRLGADLTPHIFYCYSTNMLTSSFKSCTEQFGYNNSMFNGKQKNEEPL